MRYEELTIMRILLYLYMYIYIYTQIQIEVEIEIETELAGARARDRVETEIESLNKQFIIIRSVSKGPPLRPNFVKPPIRLKLRD